MVEQIDLFAKNRSGPRVSQIPDPESIRVRLNAVLRELREADRMPWSPAQVRSWKHVFHNMANWLPPDERDRLRQDFIAEIARLERD